MKKKLYFEGVKNDVAWHPENYCEAACDHVAL
jgi:hypothetical protein